MRVPMGDCNIFHVLKWRTGLTSSIGITWPFVECSQIALLCIIAVAGRQRVFAALSSGQPLGYHR